MRGKELADTVRNTYKQLVGKLGHEETCKEIAKIVAKNDPNKKGEVYWSKTLSDYFSKEYLNQSRAGNNIMGGRII